MRTLAVGDTHGSSAALDALMAVVKPTPADLWTTCFTPRELRLLGERSGLVVDAIWSVTPGAYARKRPVVEQPEFLLLAHRPVG